MLLTSKINRVLRRIAGIEVHKTRATFDEARKFILNSSNIGLLLDGGANEGQYALRVRRDGYREKILSVEPGLSAFLKLQENSRTDNLWESINFALGSSAGKARLNVSSNGGMSSSLRNPSQHKYYYPSVKFEEFEEVSVRTIDDLLSPTQHNVYLKLDVQGFEFEALSGISASLEKIKALEVEMTLIPMYENESTFSAVVSKIEDLGFYFYSISEFGKNKHGQVTYLDIIAVKK